MRQSRIDIHSVCLDAAFPYSERFLRPQNCAHRKKMQFACNRVVLRRRDTFVSQAENGGRAREGRFFRQHRTAKPCRNCTTHLSLTQSTPPLAAAGPGFPREGGRFAPAHRTALAAGEPYLCRVRREIILQDSLYSIASLSRRPRFPLPSSRRCCCLPPFQACSWQRKQSGRHTQTSPSRCRCRRFRCRSH